MTTDFLTFDAFIDEATRVALLAKLRAAETGDAAVYGRAGEGVVDRGVRSTKRIAGPMSAESALRAMLLARLPQLAAHFDAPLTELEPLQFLRYVEGDFFVAHQDGNTPTVHDDTRFRRVSLVLFLSAPDEYAGGELLIHGSYPEYGLRHAVPASAGSLIAFRSEVTHEVTPVTRGERFTVVSWLR